MSIEHSKFSPEPILRVSNLTKIFNSGGLLAPRKTFTALDRVDVSLSPGRTLAVVGATGSGKSTLARCLVRAEEATSGEIWFDGADFRTLKGGQLRSARRKMQMLFQEATSALNPRFSAWELVAEPLLIAGQLSKSDMRTRALELMEEVGLSRQSADRMPYQFSGGQKQRLALARALICEPKIIVLDEAVSGLDGSVRAQTLNLMLEIQAKRGVAFLFITHELSLLDAIADEIAVLKNGRIVEHAETAKLLADPVHPYTQSLLAGARLSVQPVAETADIL